mgnify:CR=1 FL=1
MQGLPRAAVDEVELGVQAEALALEVAVARAPGAGGSCRDRAPRAPRTGSRSGSAPRSPCAPVTISGFWNSSPTFRQNSASCSTRSASSLYCSRSCLLYLPPSPSCSRRLLERVLQGADGQLQHLQLGCWSGAGSAASASRLGPRSTSCLGQARSRSPRPGRGGNARRRSSTGPGRLHRHLDARWHSRFPTPGARRPSYGGGGVGTEPESESEWRRLLACDCACHRPPGTDRSSAGCKGCPASLRALLVDISRALSNSPCCSSATARSLSASRVVGVERHRALEPEARLAPETRAGRLRCRNRSSCLGGGGRLAGRSGQAGATRSGNTETMNVLRSSAEILAAVAGQSKVGATAARLRARRTGCVGHRWGGGGSCPRRGHRCARRGHAAGP